MAEPDGEQAAADPEPTSLRDVGHPARKTRWAWVVGTFFGVGLLKPGPGTYGSVAAVLLWMAAALAWHPGRMWMAVGAVGAALVTTLVGIPAATVVARESGREDPGFVVIDEVAGQLIALIGVRLEWRHVLFALLLFRLFDIWKPWPVHRLEELPGGAGIMLDDVAAGVLALAVGVVLVRWV